MEPRYSMTDTLSAATPPGFAAIVLLGATAPVLAQEPEPETEAEAETEPQQAPFGLPSEVDWTFNFGATWGAFNFSDSLYLDPKPEQPSGNLTDDWFEGSIKPALTGVYTTEGAAEVYGGLSAVGERTYGAAPTLVGEDASSFEIEDAYIGWRSGTSIGDDENVVDLTMGRTRYRLGHGMLLWDGSAEGGTRGGYWTNARQAFEFAAIARLQPGNHKVEGFFLDKDDLPEADSGSELWGLNYEYGIGENGSLGITYMSWDADPNVRPERDGLDVYNLRAFFAPAEGEAGPVLEAEYALEDNEPILDSTAWNALVGYQLDRGWQPRLSYRYALFEGDDVTTPESEAFDPLFTGFSDWGSWWQGEIAGEYFVSNSNLISHQLRVHTKPRENISTGLIYYDFQLDQRAAFDPLVTSDEIGQEIDWYMDWQANEHFLFSFVVAFAEPGEALEQSTGRTDNFAYGMFFVAYQY